jgi:hypothetical protein
VRAATWLTASHWGVHRQHRTPLGGASPPPEGSLHSLFHIAADAGGNNASDRLTLCANALGGISNKASAPPKEDPPAMAPGEPEPASTPPEGEEAKKEKKKVLVDPSEPACLGAGFGSS